MGDDRDDSRWRDIDRGRDKSAHRREEHRGPARGPRLDTATAAYKRKLDAFFDRGVVPDHLKDKLAPGAQAAAPSPRQQLLRAIRDADTQRKLEQAVDQLLEQFGLPEDDMELLLRVLEHSRDAVLGLALDHVEAFLATGKPLPRKPRFQSRLRTVEAASLDMQIQLKASRVLALLR